MQSDNPTAAILVIGDEILSGRTREGNAHHLAQVLTATGIDLQEIRVVADDTDRIVDAIRALDRTLGGAYDLLFTSGGIGPKRSISSAPKLSSSRSLPCPRTARSSFHARFHTSCSPVFIPWPPNGLWMCAASPATKMRPTRRWRVCRWWMRK